MMEYRKKVTRFLFQGKSFRFILVTFLYAVCVYPPFVLMTEDGVIAGRKWEWVFTLLPTPSQVPEIDLLMLSVEAIIAVLLALLISLAHFGIKKVLWQGDRSREAGN